ncbi:hypothetical protein SAY87_005232 [Trapa incisa]|uniref:C2 domain-containing protein n=1 Tax=Trapa incisa TaxID=236973 RepID=A0AAN7Q793_9MYRT|nr:hypothetical protein SAY87_005232 [Trapa incisa]
MAPQVSSGRLLEINLISAQDLAPVSKSMRTYAVAWVHPDRKLTTRVDEDGQANPTWNEKFVFRVDEEDLESDTSEVTIEIYALTWLRVVPTGIVRARFVDLIPPFSRKLNKNVTATRFFTLQVARPSSGRPQGTLNIGVSLVNAPLRSMPLQSEVSATTYGATEMTVKDTEKNFLTKAQQQQDPNGKKSIQLWRSHSERTDDRFYASYPANSVVNDSVVIAPQAGGAGGLKQQKGGGGRGGGGGSVVGMGSLVSSIGPSASIVAAAIAKGLHPRQLHAVQAYNDDCGSSILYETMAESESVEGLRTKIERWRTEQPPLYDRKNGKPNPRGAGGGRAQRGRMNNNGGSGLFSCFGTAMGYEFSISCGGGAKRKKLQK